MADLNYTITGVQELLKKVDAVKQPALIKTGLKQGAEIIFSCVKTLLSGIALNVRSGLLRASLAKSDVEESDGVYKIRIGVNRKYAKIHEFGRTIHPTNARFLTIPSKFALTPTGQPKTGMESARALISNNPKKTFFAKNTLFLVTGKNQIRPMFFLKSSVTIPKRPYMQPAIDSEPIRADITRNFIILIEKALEE